ncbi:Uncharacterised protein [uncultured archaeon]|nr:Uncharacterised protein [uncultured archaeon]
MNTNKLLLSAAIFSVLLIIVTNSVSAQFYTQNYTNPTLSSNNQNLVIQVLKYEPYPVNAGDWFDLWLEVQNIGSGDAKNVRFQLSPDYPFSSTDSLVNEYPVIYGATSANLVKMPVDASTVILKYRVKVADNAPYGTSNLKLIVSVNNKDPSVQSVQYILPIEIGKTKTDFDVVMQDSTSQGTSFAIANIGENSATAVSVKIKKDELVKTTGSEGSILGNLAQGDFTTVTFQIYPNQNLQNATLEISYTDIAGVRNVIEKVVPVNINSNFGQTNTKTSSSSSGKYLYLGFGIVLGVIVVLGYRKIRKKK